MDVVLGGPTAGTPLKTDATEAAPQIDPAELDRYLRRFAREIGEPHVAVFGILDDETGLYTYRYARVTFDKVGARTMVHLIPDPDDPTLIRGIAAARVPDDPESMRQWTAFLMPQGDHEGLGKVAIDQACSWETVVTVPEAWIQVDGGRWMHVPAVTVRRCITQCKSLDSTSCSPPLREPFPLPPPPPFPDRDPIETILPTKPCAGDILPIMRIRPTGPGKSLESGRFRTCIGTSCAPGTKAVRSGEDGNSKPHHGIDLECKLGDPIFALFDGEFVETDYQVNRNRIGYGRKVEFVSAVGGEPLYWGYAHLQDSGFFSGPRGRRVTAGQIVGYCGNTGNSSTERSHVHLDVSTGCSSGFSFACLADPEDWITTKFDHSGNPTNPNPCNQ